MDTLSIAFLRTSPLLGLKSYSCCRMCSACAVGETLEAFVRVTNLSLRVNSGKQTTKLRASRDFLFSVSTVSRDVKRCSRSPSRYEKLWSPCSLLK